MKAEKQAIVPRQAWGTVTICVFIIAELILFTTSTIYPLARGYSVTEQGNMFTILPEPYNMNASNLWRSLLLLSTVVVIVTYIILWRWLKRNLLFISLAVVTVALFCNSFIGGLTASQQTVSQLVESTSNLQLRDTKLAVLPHSYLHHLFDRGSYSLEQLDRTVRFTVLEDTAERLVIQVEEEGERR